jgi:hypothetical protein
MLVLVLLGVGGGLGFGIVRSAGRVRGAECLSSPRGGRDRILRWPRARAAGAARFGDLWFLVVLVYGYGDWGAGDVDPVR